MTFTGQKILDGELASQGAFPHQVSLQIFGRHICGAVVIDSRVLATAAHCFRNINYADIRAVVGEQKLNGGDGTGQVQRVQELKKHDNFNAETTENDIALLLLTEALTINDYVRPVQLWQQSWDLPGEKEKNSVPCVLH